MKNNDAIPLVDPSPRMVAEALIIYEVRNRSTSLLFFTRPLAEEYLKRESTGSNGLHIAGRMLFVPVGESKLEKKDRRKTLWSGQWLWPFRKLRRQV